MNQEDYEAILKELKSLRSDVDALAEEVERTNARAADDLKHVYAAMKRFYLLNEV